MWEALNETETKLELYVKKGITIQIIIGNDTHVIKVSVPL